MSKPENDTLTPRNHADFPIVEGPVTLRTYNPLPTLPNVNFPAGTEIIDGTSSPTSGLPVVVSQDGLTWKPAGSALPAGTDGQFLGHVAGVPAYVTLTQDMVGPAFAVSVAISGVANPQEAGASIVNPQFTDSHNQTPQLASLTGPDAVNHTISPATLTALGYGGANNTFPAQTFTDDGLTLNKVFSWTYSATAGGITRTASTSITFERRCYFDIVNIPGGMGGYNASFILSLTSSRLQGGFATNYAFAAGDGVKYSHLAIPTGWGNPNVFKEHISQLPVAWSHVASGINVVNGNGVTISYEIWRAPQANTSAFSYDVS